MPLCPHSARVHTSVIMGNPRMKKETQQTRVNRGLCFLRYLGNSSDTEVTMVSMVANWKGHEWWENVTRRRWGAGRKKSVHYWYHERYLIKRSLKENSVKWSFVKLRSSKDLCKLWANAIKDFSKDSDWLSPPENYWDSSNQASMQQRFHWKASSAGSPHLNPNSCCCHNCWSSSIHGINMFYCIFLSFPKQINPQQMKTCKQIIIKNLNDNRETWQVESGD